MRDFFGSHSFLSKKNILRLICQKNAMYIKQKGYFRISPEISYTYQYICRICAVFVWPKDYLFENCGARLAALRPYFNRLSDDFP